MSVINKPAPQKKVRLTIWLSEDHKERVERAAATTGQTPNHFVASEVVKRADEIIEKGKARRQFSRDRDHFLALLDAGDAPREN